MPVMSSSTHCYCKVWSKGKQRTNEMNSNAHLCSAWLCGVIPSPLNSLCRQECPCISHPLAFTSWVQVEQMCANMSGLCRAGDGAQGLVHARYIFCQLSSLLHHLWFLVVLIIRYKTETALLCAVRWLTGCQCFPRGVRLFK